MVTMDYCEFVRTSPRRMLHPRILRRPVTHTASRRYPPNSRRHRARALHARQHRDMGHTIGRAVAEDAGQSRG